MEITGKITKVNETISGTTAAGSEWKKLFFLVETTEKYNNLYCFNINRGVSAPLYFLHK